MSLDIKSREYVGESESDQMLFTEMFFAVFYKKSAEILWNEKWTQSAGAGGDLGFRATGFTSLLSMSPTHPES